MATSRTQHAEQFPIGSTAGTGEYRCCKCNRFTATLTGPEDQIPPCEICGSGDDVKFRPIDLDAESSHGVGSDR